MNEYEGWRQNEGIQRMETKLGNTMNGDKRGNRNVGDKRRTRNGDKKRKYKEWR